MTLASILVGLLLATGAEWRFPTGGDGWRHPIAREFGAPDRGRFHAGLDVATPCGTEVRAIGPGEVVHVVRSDPDGTGAREVVTRHPDGAGEVYVQLAHLMTVTVGPGPVEGGEVLGRTGRTARGCHLHVALRRGAPPGAGLTRRPPAELGYLAPTAWLQERVASR